MAEIYRSYEMLIEETVRQDHPKRSESSKPSRFCQPTVDALALTNRMFQDAVCYYVLALSGLAKDKELNPLWNHITNDADMKAHTQKVVEHLSDKYPKAPFAGVKDVNTLLTKIYWSAYSAEGAPKLYAHLEKIALKEKKGNKKKDAADKLDKLAKFTSDHIRLLCSEKSGQNMPGEVALPRIHRTLKDMKTALDNDVMEKVQAFVSDEEEREKPQFIHSKENLLEAFGREKREVDCSIPAGDCDKIIAEISTGGETDCVWFGVGHYSKIAWTFNRYIWIVKHSEFKGLRLAALADLREFAKKNPAQKGSGAADLPGKVGKGAVFLPFTRHLGIKESKADFAWEHFDKAAFKRAAEDVFKYKFRTKKRHDDFTTLDNDLRCYFLGEGKWTEEKTKKGKIKRVYSIRGMNNDPRKERIEKLLNDDMGGGLGKYGLRRGTIGGWAELRPKLLAVLKQASNKDEIDEEKLAAAVQTTREQSAGGFGDVNFFNELCKSKNHELWEELDEKHQKQYPHHAPDFIRFYVKYLEAVEKRDRLKGDIRFTWPGQDNRHGKPSYRPFDFPGSVTTGSTVSLFSHPDDGKKEYKLGEFKLTLSGRRLKRDRIMTVEGNSIESIWMPPLITERAVLLNGARLTDAEFESKKLPALFQKFSPESLSAEGNALCQKVWEEFSPATKSNVEAWQKFDPKPYLTKKKVEDAKRLCFLAAKNSIRSDLNALITSGQSFYYEALFSSIKMPKKLKQMMDQNPQNGELAKLNRMLLELVFPTEIKKAKWKHLEVSFSLLAPKQPIDKPPTEPFHLMVSLAVNEAELQSCRVPRLPGKGSVWRKRYFQWSEDLDIHAIEEAKKTDPNNSSENEDDDKPEKVTAADLWCSSVFQPFHVLSVDLGVRSAAAFCRASVQIGNGEKPDNARVISPLGFQQEIWFKPYHTGTCCLQGEDAKVFHRPKGGPYSKDAVEEKYGSRGRLSTPEEVDRFCKLAADIFPEKGFPIPKDPAEVKFFPALGDHLVTRLYRRLGRIGFLFNLRWRVDGKTKRNDKGEYTIPEKPDEQSLHRDQQRMRIIESLGKPMENYDPAREEDGWNQDLRLALATTEIWTQTKETRSQIAALQKGKKKNEAEELALQLRNQIADDKDESKWKWSTLSQKIQEQLDELIPKLNSETGENLMERVAAFVWSLRDKNWRWRGYRKMDAGQPERHSLLEVPNQQPNQAKAKIAGMRGLSMKRIELLQEFRRCCQSLAKHELRYAQKIEAGKPGLEPMPTLKDEEVHDPCPALLEKINNLRDQRVYQTAHMILAEALGLELKNPADVSIDGKQKWELKSERDVHGQYTQKALKCGEWKDKPAPRCSVIVIEDLSRYLTSQDRSRFENRRLMEWSHRQVITKLQDMAKVFGVTVIAVNAAYSSRFSSRTGCPGIRVKEVARGFENEYPWSKWKAETAKKSGNRVKTERALRIQKVVEDLNGVYGSNPKRTLLLDMDGGQSFLPVVPHNDGEGLEANADINAAVNIGLRALAHPDRLDIFPVVKTEALGDQKLRLINKRGTIALKTASDNPLEVKPEELKSKNDGTEKTETAADAEDDDELESSQRPNLYVAIPVKGERPFDIGRKERHEFIIPSQKSAEPGMSYSAAKGGFYWTTVKDKAIERIESINKNRIEKSNKPEK